MPIYILSAGYFLFLGISFRYEVIKTFFNSKKKLRYL
jgi:hypothetical protein